MKGFWTCGPFKQADDRRELMKYRIEQMEKFLEILDSYKEVEEKIQSDSIEEKYLGLMMKGDVERDLRTILGIGNDGQEEDSKILGEAILESLTRSAKE